VNESTRPRIRSARLRAGVVFVALAVLALLLPGLHLVAEPHGIDAGGKLVHTDHGTGCHHHCAEDGAEPIDRQAPAVAPEPGCHEHHCTDLEWLRERLAGYLTPALAGGIPLIAEVDRALPHGAPRVEVVARLRLAPKHSPPTLG